MATIGQFRLTHEGYEGTISTLSMARKVRIVPNGNKKNENSPDFFVKTGQCDLGFAHRKISEGQSPRPYLKVFLDDPSFVEPIWAALFEQDGKAELVWSRPRPTAS